MAVNDVRQSLYFAANSGPPDAPVTTSANRSDANALLLTIEKSRASPSVQTPRTIVSLTEAPNGGARSIQPTGAR